LCETLGNCINNRRIHFSKIYLMCKSKFPVKPKLEDTDFNKLHTLNKSLMVKITMQNRVLFVNI